MEEATREENKTPAAVFCDACARDDLETVKKMLEEDESFLQCMDPSGYTPLHWTALYNCTACAEYLLGSGADALAKGAHGDTPLHWATAISSEVCLDLILRHLLEINEPVKGVGSSYAYEFLELQDDAGLTPMHHAAESGNALALHYFLCIGQDINTRDADQRTPLHWAAHTGSVIATRYLLNRSRCLIDATDRQGDTSLHWATTKGNASIVKILLESNACATLQNDDGKTPLDVAKKFKFHRISHYISDAIQEKRHPNRSLDVDHNPIFRYFAFIAPMFIEMILLYGLCTFPIISWGTLVTIGTVVLVVIAGKPLFFPNHPSTSPFTYGHVCGAVFIHLILYYVHVYPYIDDYVWLNRFFAIILLPYWYYLIRSHFQKPGYYQGPVISRETISEQIQSTLTVSNFCVTCLHQKPIRSKHCIVCNRCCLRFDHHCPFIDNCIGTPGNQRGSHYYFICFLSISNFMHLIMEIFLLICVYRLPDRPALYSLYYLFWFMYHNYSFVLCLILFNCLHHFWEILLLQDQLRCMFYELTINEWVTRKRCKYLSKLPDGDYESVFNQGCLANTSKFMSNNGSEIMFEYPGFQENQKKRKKITGIVAV